MPNPKVQFFDDNGDPLSGGKIYSYEAGTSTPKATYSEATGTTENANPVILDSRGEAAIYLSGAYKLILKDSDDVQIWSMDNVSLMPYTTVEQSEWVDQALTLTYSSATVFTVPGDETATFLVGRRVKATVSAGTVYGVIKTSAYTTLTTVTLVMDSGALDSGLSDISVGIITPSNTSLPGLYALPRYTTTQEGNLTAAAGMMLYNTTSSGYRYYNAAWRTVANLDEAQTLTNKTLTTPTLTTPKIVTAGYIADAGGDEYLEFVESTTPVNHIRITQGDTGVGPTLSAQGETNVDLQLAAKGTGLIKFSSGVLGAWDATKVKDTAYLAASDLMVQVNTAAAGDANILTDASNPPTTARATIGTALTTQGVCYLSSLVKKGDYWKVTAGGTPTINIIPIGA